MSDPFKVVRQFEAALAIYTGAPFCITTTSCTQGLLMALVWLRERYGYETVNIPKLTYVGVGMSILNSGHKISFRDEDWQGEYQLRPYQLWDAARRLTSKMFRPGSMQVLSFHWSKHLGIQQGGAILTDDPDAAAWLQRARFDGRQQGVAPKDDTFDMLGWHAYMAPETAAAGLMRLSLLPRYNADLRRSDYSDLSTAPIFGGKRMETLAAAAE